MSEAVSTAAKGRARGAGRPGPIRLLLNNTLAASGLVLLVLIIAAALLAPLLPLPDPDATAPADRLLRPLTEGHLLGTDALGRDILSRLVWGTRVSLAVGISATLIAAFFGSLIGLVAGYAGGRVDAFLMRGIDMVMAFPYILLALAIVAALGPGLLNALYAIAVVNIPFFARNIRGITIGLSRREFVDAARLSGKSNAGILFGEILPNVLPVIIITMSTTIGWMILETAGLSFLGLGAQPPQADLGSMLGEGRKILFTAPHVSIIPGLMIFALVMSINLLGDGVRDVLDPRLKSGALTRPVARTAVERRTVPETRTHGDSVLEVADLNTEFHIGGDVYRAVGGIDLHLKQGECLGIVGESGSGKSVTAMSLMGLVPTPPGRITGGAAWLDGEDLFAVSDERIRALRGADVSHVFQDPLSTLHPLFTIGDQLTEAIMAHRPIRRSEADARAEELLRLVRITNPAERLKVYPHELSGGMRQRVCIAMALANDAKIIIADEPTTALDVTVQAQILSLMDTLRRESNAAILFITHDFGVVSAVCDRVAVMYAGRIVETGTTEEVLNAPAHPYTRKLIDCVPVLGEPGRRLDAIEGRPPVVNDLPPGCAFAARCPRVKPDCRRGHIALSSLGDTQAVRCLYPLTGETADD
ncbi:dipeptide/oligopeptide/nickel ABC transporter permease/ATP-binding protein [Nitratireductor aquimarinus]|uniref:dipeptide/oligopeptide/nickel ABC transporter permease/ATP-binding protein n=1 Tax=Alphaproteobacteria TaxID=28211 RepID=UPI000DE0F0AC|nr:MULTISPECIES: dipeptide/oligopeptide/nickel ABC transporter permease/ATP-binding protein [Alphaproteobacteria]MBY6024500.1 dipeptide/oligopeptide/nickel ABC transporter permease/ATP-binding protein [Nitratireductor sp. DP7N14-4]MBN7759217.1 dipeptide/oligopeptide/nickel ABC transporter permease/ATP-binding protein [Nitratireductor aquimarinus]MBN8243792.1 dipeptide/oligopeptide/nickel ABC transporter permease/ATP-binding protein [Nitratireductor aquimarinus]MBY6002094.1 dipeptide/oligopeptid